MSTGAEGGTGQGLESKRYESRAKMHGARSPYFPTAVARTLQKLGRCNEGQRGRRKLFNRVALKLRSYLHLLELKQPIRVRGVLG